MKISRTLQLLQRPGPPTLLVSLPANDEVLARAAVDGGAECLKVHINIIHAAAGVRFGSLAEEAHALERIVAIGVPVGVVPGDAGTMADAGDIRRLNDLGLDFIDAYLSAMPAWMLYQDDMPVMAALGHADLQSPGRLTALAGMPRVSMVEASIVEHGGYGRDLSVGDLCDYTGIAQVLQGSQKPVIVPTQRRILPDDVAGLAATGIKGLLIGAIVTGADAATIHDATRSYRNALENCWRRGEN